MKLFYKNPAYKRILENRAILYFIFILSIINLIVFAWIGDLKTISVFALSGFVVSFLNKNMIVILFFAIILSNIYKYGVRNIRESMKNREDLGEFDLNDTDDYFEDSDYESEDERGEEGREEEGRGEEGRRESRRESHRESRKEESGEAESDSEEEPLPSKKKSHKKILENFVGDEIYNNIIYKNNENQILTNALDRYNAIIGSGEMSSLSAMSMIKDAETYLTNALASNSASFSSSSSK